MDGLRKCNAEATTHLHTICEFSLNRPPLRPKVDKQSYDELKPGVDRALAVLQWYVELQQHFVAVIRELAGTGGPPSSEALALLIEAVDVLVVLENQFSGWSACVNRFSWFKRTFTQIRREVAAETDAEKLTRDISKFQGFIGNASFPLGMHMTGPLRTEVQKVQHSQRPLLAALQQLASAASAKGEADPACLRPLPYLLYLADGESSGGFNVFDCGAKELAPVQKVFKRYPMAECSPPSRILEELHLPGSHPVHLGTVLARCPHYTSSMRTKVRRPQQRTLQQRRAQSLQSPRLRTSRTPRQGARTYFCLRPEQPDGVLRVCAPGFSSGCLR